MKVHKLSPYTTQLVVIVDNDPVKRIAKELKKYPGLDLEWKDAAATTYGRTYTDPKTNRQSHFIFVVLGPHGMDYEAIAHEACHVTNFVFEYHGVTLSTEFDEHQAYLLGHVAAIIAGETINQMGAKAPFSRTKPKKKK